MHRLRALLEAAARGEHPPADGEIEILPPPPGRAMAVVAFTAHHAIATAAPASWLSARLAAGDLLAPMTPAFLTALADRLSARADGIDVVLAATGLPGRPRLIETDIDDPDHPRVARARARREDVRAFEDSSGKAVVILGRGLAHRAEVAVEVDSAHRGDGLARAALTEARRLVGTGEVLFAQTAPGNAASLRAILAAGFAPVGSEVLFFAAAPVVRVSSR